MSKETKSNTITNINSRGASRGANRGTGRGTGRGTSRGTGRGNGRGTSRGNGRGKNMNALYDGSDSDEDIKNKPGMYDATMDLRDDGFIEGDDEGDNDDYGGSIEEHDGEDDIGDAEDDDIDLGGEGDVDNEDCAAYDVTRGQKGVKKIGIIIDKEDDYDDDDGIDVVVDENDTRDDLYVKPSERRTKKYLTTYERVRLLGDRTSQIAQGAKPMIKGVESLHPKIIAQLELESKMIPLIVVRPLPNGKKEKFYLRELKLKKKYIIYGFTGGNVDIDKINKINNEYKKGGSIIGYSQLAEQYNSK